MQIAVAVKGHDMDEERLARATRALLRDIRADADPSARLIANESPQDAKGPLLMLGQIAADLVSSDFVAKFVEGLFRFLSQNRKIEIEIQGGPGASLKLSMDFIDRYGTDKAMHLAKEFIKKMK